MAVFPPVLILAGGLGTRLKTLTGDLPKSLVPVHRRPFIQYQLGLLSREGVNDVVICVGHRSEPLIEYVGDGQEFGLNVQYAHDGDKLLGTGGAVLRASELVGSPFAVLYGDSYLDFEWAPVYKAFVQSGKKALMTVFNNDNAFIPSNILFRDGQIVEYNKDEPHKDMHHVDFGLSIFSREAFAQEPGSAFDLSEVVQRLIAEHQLAGYETQQRFYEVGTPEGVMELEEYLKMKSKRWCE
jgi:NDP-sugar pyrophosphorylase family protein